MAGEGLKEMTFTYKQAGVDVEAGYRAVDLMKEHVRRTARSEVLGGLGSFGGAFELDLKSKSVKHPVLISGTDGVGTKLKIAHLIDKHDTVGIDCVAMCVNDIACSGAEPLFFLDYIACGKNEPDKIAEIVKGVAEGCVQAGCALIGGETAEMPGFYAEDEYDIAGFSTGMVEKKKMVSSEDQKVGDILIGIESSGVHSNGFSLIRKVFDIDDNPKVLDNYVDELGKTLGEELITPTFIYSKAMIELNNAALSKGFMHITGGGFFENIPRGLKPGLGAKIARNNLPVKPIFEILQEKAEMNLVDLCSTFNAGIGMVVVVDKDNVNDSISIIASAGHRPHLIGELKTEEGVEIL